MATPEEVEETLRLLIERLQGLDPAYRSLLPAHRVVEVEFPDLAATYHAEWRAGSLTELREGPAAHPHIRAVLDSNDLAAMVAGDLTFRRAYATNRVRLEASMTDLLRLRSVL